MAMGELERMKISPPERIKPGRLTLLAKDISFNYSGKPILNKASFSIQTGEKVALVGPNGVGKTTLINIIRGKLVPASGEIIIPRDIQIGFLPQTIREADLPQTGSVGDFIMSARGLNELESKMRDLEKEMRKNQNNNQALEEYGRVQEKYELLDGYKANQEVLRLLADLGLENVDLDTRVDILSGGQKTRLFLTRVLFSNPTLLLLDEPTNHLDEPVLDRLAEYLKNFQGALLVVSHEQKFLDATVEKVLRLNEFTHQLEDYTGNYTAFLNLRSHNEQILEKRRKAQEKEIKRLYKAINRWKRRGKRAREAKTMEKRVKRLEEVLIEIPRHSKKLGFQLEVRGRSSERVLNVESLNKSFDGHAVVHEVSFKLFRGERLAILGPNGAGKSTLLKMLVGELEPDSGHISLGERVSVGYYAQEHEGLNFSSAVLDEARSMQPSLPEHKLRAFLGRFSFSGDEVYKEVSMLSPGERAKLALAKLMLGGFNTLVLDEPTNHLDMESRRSLMEVLAEFKGSLIITSHDGELLDNLNPDKILVMLEGRLEHF